MTDRIECWWFGADDRRLTHGDGRMVKVGRTHSVKGAVVACENALHGSTSPLAALEFAAGSLAYRVELWGDLGQKDDSAIYYARHRKYLAVFDAAPLLHEFACRCAEDALAVAKNPDARSVEAIRVKRKWLKGKATDAELDAAEDAAWAAAEDAAGDAARAAAWDAAEAAAWAAARAAAGAAAWAAARDAEREWQRERFIKLLEEAKLWRTN